MIKPKSQKKNFKSQNQIKDNSPQKNILIKYQIHSFIFSRKKKQDNMFDTKKQKTIFFVLKIRKHDVFKEFFLVIFTYFVRLVLKNNYTNIKNDLK